jgi:sec-independent protein translocase protein TatA
MRIVGAESRFDERGEWCYILGAEALAMGLGFGELVILLIIVLLVFGAGKLPQIGDALGKSIKNFKRAAAGKDEIDVTPKKELADKPPADAPKNG